MTSEGPTETSDGPDSVEKELREALAPDRSADASSVRGEADFSREGFDLEEQIGEGGMATVYRGVHRHTGQPVAIKLLERVANPGELENFHREIQAHAGLTHPGIVYLFEYGAIEASNPADLGSRRREYPYVIMELADHGSLRKVGPIEDWRRCRRLLLEVLDALAFAHARGVVHRDLKPANLLIFDRRDAPGRQRVKLTDFGVAHAFEHEPAQNPEQLAASIGTPHYMAPEQIRGNWRRYGPWTDLYALGCVAWELVCGRRPFEAESSFELFEQHVGARRPSIEPRYPVPEKLEEWIHRAMEIRAEDRFRRAADAAAALPGALVAAPSIAVPSAGDCGSESHGAEGEPASGVTAPLFAPARTRPSTTARSEDVEFVERGSVRAQSAPPGPTGTAPAPIVGRVCGDWRRESREDPPAPLVGAGLGLFGLRDPPFVDRNRERERIWQALQRVAGGGCEIVLLTGPAGSGKSRLAKWVATRAHELGAAERLRTVHTRTSGGRTEGLAGTIRRALHGWNLDRRGFYERLRDALPPLPDDEFREVDARALTEYVHPTPEGATAVEGPPYQFSSADQKRALMQRFLRRFAVRRPLVWWVDDLQWGERTLGLLEHLRDAAVDAPRALVVATVRSELLVESRGLADRLEAIANHRETTRIAVEELDGDDQCELLQGVLPLEDELASDLARRTEGRPLFAMQLLGHWIEAGEIEFGDDGFRVPRRAELELPEDVHELWMERVERLLRESPDDAISEWLESLELAAALGGELDREEWEAVLTETGLESPDGLVVELVERGLAESTSEGWAFTHGLLTESLARRSRAEGRWQGHHRCCARVLEQSLDPEVPGAHERLADHWVEAGLRERALGPLLEEIQLRAEIGDERARRRLLQRRDELLDATGVPEDDVRRFEQRIEWGNVISKKENVEEARELLEQLWSDLDESHTRLQCRTACLLARVEYQRGDWEPARRWGEIGLEAARRSGDPRLESGARVRLATIALHETHLDRAERHADRAFERAKQVDARHLELTALRLRTTARQTRGDVSTGEAYERVRRVAARAGYVSEEARALNGLGESARFAGRLGEAREYYRQYLERMEELYRPKAQGNAHLNLAQLELCDGAPEVAVEHLRAAERNLEALGVENTEEGILHLLRLTHAAARGDAPRFSELWEPLRGGWNDDWWLFKDHPWTLEVAAEYADEVGWRQRAREAASLARDLWRELGNEEAAERAAARLAEFG